MSAVSCARAEALLAARALAPEAEGVPPPLRAHLDSCDECLRLARELENPVVLDALGEAAESGIELLDLAVVPSENYVRGKEIGRGGMGRIVRARDRRLGRAVAIKELLDERLRDRFEREARLTARLQHPAIVSVHEAGRWPGGEPFYAMKLVAGRPLDRLISETPTLAGRLALLPHFITVVDAIAYAHSEQVIHRDLKPHNVLVGPFGETVVIDWGLAKDLASSEPEPAGPYRDAPDSMTRAGAGTPAYMPPEQAEGRAADERIDVYALGATLYHIVSGAAPAAARRPLAEVAPEAPAELTTIATKAMAVDPADRYPSARELAEDLRRFQSGQLVGAHRYTARALVGRWLRRHRLAVFFAAAFVVALAAVGAVSVARVVAARRDAVAERDRARGAFAELLAERGRQELLGGAPARALVYLQQALAGGVDTPALRFLLAEAQRSTAPLIFSVPATRVAALDGAGALLAAGDPVRLWDVASGKELATLPTSGERIVFAAGGERLLVVGRGRPVVEIWDVGSRKLVAALAHDGPVEGAIWSDDGQRVLSWAGKTARVWTAAGAPLAVLRDEGELRGGAFDAAGGRVLTAGRDGKARVWDAVSGALLVTLVGHESGVAGGAFEPTGAGFATAGWEGNVLVWDAAGKLLRKLALGESVRAVSYTPDGRVLLAHGISTARLWRAATGDVVATLGQGGFGVAAARLVGDGTRVLIAAGDGVARLYDVSGAPGAIFEGHTARMLDASASGDGERLVTVGAEGSVKVWQRGGRAEPRVVLVGEGTRVAFDPGGRMLAISRRMLALWDAATGRLLAARQLDTQPGWARRPHFGGLTGERIRIIDNWGERLEWDPASGILVQVGTGPMALASSPAGDRILSGSRASFDPGRGQSLRVVDPATGALVSTLEDSGNAGDPFFSFDGRMVAAHLRDPSRMRVWDAASGRVRATLPGLAGRDGVAFSPDGRSLFVYGEDLDGQLWDVERGELTQVFRGHTDRLRSAAFSPDGAMILTGSQDGTAKLWDVRTGQPLASWTFAGGSVHQTGISPDGRSAFVVPYLGAAQVLDISRDPRDAAAIAADVAARVPFRLHEGRLLPASLPKSLHVAVKAPLPPPSFGCPPGTRRHGAPPPRDLIAWCALADGVRHGPMTIFWPDGGKLLEARFIDGMPFGETTTFYRAGAVETVITVDGLRWTVTRFHENGVRRSVASYHGMSPVGPYTEWYPSGALRETGSYNDCTGDKGCVMRSPLGLWMTYYEDGRKESEGRYYARRGYPILGAGRDVRLGEWTFWDRAGVARVERFDCPPGTKRTVSSGSQECVAVLE